MGKVMIGLGHLSDIGLEAVNKAVGQLLQARQVYAFSVGGHQAHGGKKWAALSPKTIRKKKSSAILIHTGGLRNTIHVASTPKAFHVIAPKFYAEFHQYAIRLPVRKVLDITAQDKSFVKVKYQELLTRLINLTK